MCINRTTYNARKQVNFNVLTENNYVLLLTLKIM